MGDASLGLRAEGCACALAAVSPSGAFLLALCC